jgi:exodeoxyribonuclease III
LRLVTWNCNSLKARLPRLLELLDEHAPDVLCLQETKCTPEAMPHETLAVAGYRVVDHSAGRWNGVALAVPDGIEVDDVQRGLPGEPDPTEARWIEGTIRGVRWISLYVPNGREPGHEMYVQKLAFLDAARSRLTELVASGPVVAAGDWNVAPHDRDVWDPAMFVGSTHVTPEERSRVAALLDLGFVDAYREVDPDGVQFTWWDYRMGAFRRRMGMRLDLVLVSHHLDVRDAAVDTTYRRVNRAGDKPSDHAPLVVTFDLDAASPTRSPPA